MANQSYHYGYGSGGGPRRGGGDRSFWVLALVFLFLFPPAGILMIVIKLASGGKKRGRHPYYTQQEQSCMGSRTVQMGRPEGRAPNPGTVPAVNYLLSQMASKAKKLTIAGTVLTAIFGFIAMATISNSLFWLFDGEIAWFLEDTLLTLCFFGGSLGCLWAGLRRQKRVRTFRSYLAMIGSRDTISISALSSAMGVSPAKVRDTLEDMLDDGFFPLGYLDYGHDRLVLTSDGIADPPQEEKKADPEPPETDPQNAILEEIRTINGGIDNPKLNQQIDRIGAITAKVFEYQRSHPQKSAQLHSFLSYYLPTTLKILRAYAQLEDQEVEGENISAAMERIEGMMDKVVEGFEKQLDQLFQGDALDITADVEVLERMLAKDGLSSGSQLHLGG